MNDHRRSGRGDTPWTLEDAQVEGTHWSARLMVPTSGTSRTASSRIWRFSNDVHEVGNPYTSPIGHIVLILSIVTTALYGSGYGTEGTPIGVRTIGKSSFAHDPATLLSRLPLESALYGSQATLKCLIIAKPTETRPDSRSAE